MQAGGGVGVVLYGVIEEGGGCAFRAVVVDGFVDDEGGEVVAVGGGVVVVGGVELDGGVLGLGAGEGGADERDPDCGLASALSGPIL